MDEERKEYLRRKDEYYRLRQKRAKTFVDYTAIKNLESTNVLPLEEEDIKAYRELIQDMSHF